VKHIIGPTAAAAAESCTDATAAATTGAATTAAAKSGGDVACVKDWSGGCVEFVRGLLHELLWPKVVLSQVRHRDQVLAGRSH
jgi:hypothetical protein